MISCEDYIINSAELGKSNPLPDIKNISYIHAGYAMTDRITEEERRGIGKGMISTILPYKIQDGYNRQHKPRTFRAIRLENKYLRAIFLPELGGRLWSLYDKEGGRELLYKNSVFQPANLALRNAWFSGGIEFNVGIKGHNPLTCSPIFAEILDYADHGQVLKMYEFERIREISYSISVSLPENSKLLYIRECIENNSDEQKYVYWWSNIAVPETENTRIVVPAEESYLSSYNEGQYLIDKIKIPQYSGKDISYPKNSKRSQDFFYKIPDGNSKWIAAVQEDGRGLLQLSDQKMIGRKLFVWGQGVGGRNWGEWLSEKGQSYVEIQAGLARTQLEHLPMKANSSWQWTEAYGAIECDKSMVHSSDWKQAQNAVCKAFGRSLKPADIEKDLLVAFPDESFLCERKTVQCGSGWGSLENMIRKREGKPLISNSCEYPDISLDAEQRQWINLLNNGEFLPVSPEEEPVSYISGNAWRSLLEKAAEQSGKQQWYALLQLGVYYYIHQENDCAESAWKKSVSLCESSWAYRNLAILYKNEYDDIGKAIKYIERSVKLNKSCRGILIDCAKLYTDNGLDKQWLELFGTLDESLKNDGRIRLFKAIAQMNLGDINAACDVVNEQFVMNDIQEGEVSLSHIWQKLYLMRLQRETGITDFEELKRQTAKIYPLPRKLDFRMHE